MSKCPICLIEQDGMPMPCGIGPRVYVGTTGYIEAVIPGCPNEQVNTPNYLPSGLLRTMGEDDEKLSKRALRRFADIAMGLNNAHYQDLWSSRNRENNHLDFDPRERVEERMRTSPDSLFDIQSVGYIRSENAYREAVSRIEGERGGSYVVSNHTLLLLQTSRTRSKRASNG